MVIDVSLYLKNENEEIHCPVSLPYVKYVSVSF